MVEILFIRVGPGPKESTWGCAILSAFPILSARTYILPGVDENGVILETLHQIDMSTQIYFLTTHFGINDAELKHKANISSKIIKQQISHSLETGIQAVLFAGDFNSPFSRNDSAIWDILKETNLIDSYTRANRSQRPTHIRKGTVDYILFWTSQSRNRSTLRLLNATVITESGQASDHFPLTAVFDYS